jgi:hypothetical protein
MMLRSETGRLGKVLCSVASCTHTDQRNGVFATVLDPVNKKSIDAAAFSDDVFVSCYDSDCALLYFLSRDGLRFRVRGDGDDVP